MSTLGIVILNYNGIALLDTYLPKLNELCTLGDVIVADNASDDGSILHVMHHYPWVKTVSLHHNIGYAGGYNSVLKDLNYEFVLILNNDLWITKMAVEHLLRYMQNHPSCAAVQPLILSDVDSNYFDYAGAAGGHIDMLGYPFCRGRLFDVCEQNHGQYTTSNAISWVSGACFMLRLNDFKAVGGFASSFFSHMEEIDLCWRFLRLKKELAVVAEAYAYHLGGGTLKHGSAKKVYYNYRNNLLMLFRNLPLQRLYIIIPARLILDGISCIPFLIKGKFKLIYMVLKAHLSFYKSIPELMRFRKKWNVLAPCTVPKHLYRNSIVMDYFIFKKRVFSDLNPRRF
jgi:GT2 family glycosyltransferase